MLCIRAEDAQARFWTRFGDDTLDRLVEEALEANHDLRIALGHLVEARAERRQAQFDLAPTVTMSGGYTNERFAQVQSLTGTALDARFYDAGFDAYWELDLFGRVRRNVEAQSAQVQGAEATLRDAQVSVTAEVARTYFELRGQQTQLAVARRNVDNQRATLQLTQARLDAGRGTEFDTSRAQSQLSTTLATIGPLEASVARSIHRLSVLTGREPNALAALLEPARELPVLPQLTAVGDPAGLLRRRPDIRVAERQLAASTALVGVAIGDLFPKVTFTGSLSYAATEPGYFGQSASRGYVIAPGISWAAFDLGRVRARSPAAARGRTSPSPAMSRRYCAPCRKPKMRSSPTRARARACRMPTTRPRRAARRRASHARVTRAAWWIFWTSSTPNARSWRPKAVWRSRARMRPPA